MRIGEDVRVYDGSVVRLAKFTPEDRARANALTAQFGGIVTATPMLDGVAVAWSGRGDVSVRAATYAEALAELASLIAVHISHVA